MERWQLSGDPPEVLQLFASPVVLSFRRRFPIFFSRVNHKLALGSDKLAIISASCLLPSFGCLSSRRSRGAC